MAGAGSRGVELLSRKRRDRRIQKMADRGREGEGDTETADGIEQSCKQVVRTTWWVE